MTMTVAKTDTGVLTEQIDQIVGEIKQAIRAVAGDTSMNGNGVVVTDAEVTLQAVVTKDLGGDFTFKIFGHDLGAGFDLKKADTQTIKVGLKPSDLAPLAPEDAIADDLAAAMRSIRDSVAHAAVDAPAFTLGEGSVELNFEVDKEGKINFVAAGSRQAANTQTIALTLRPA